MNSREIIIFEIYHNNSNVLKKAIRLYMIYLGFTELLPMAIYTFYFAS
jgi:hypothetical protein